MYNVLCIMYNFFLTVYFITLGSEYTSDDIAIMFDQIFIDIFIWGGGGWGRIDVIKIDISLAQQCLIFKYK